MAINCVGIICFRDDDVLLIRRGKAPRKGDWSIPGGRIEPGESEQVAALRELHEETGVKALLGAKVIALEANFEGQDYILHDYIAYWESGEVIAADDAMDARFASIEELGATEMWTKTRQVIEMARRIKNSNM